MITLYGEPHWDSPWVYSVYVALREKGVPFHERAIDLAAGEQRRDAYQQRTLTAKVPAIENDGFWLTESSAIVEYLDDAFADPRMIPAEPQLRARCRQIVSWLRSDLLKLREERPTTTMFFQRATAPLSEKAAADAAKLISITRTLLAAAPSPATLFRTFSIADADLAFALHRLILNGDEVDPRVRAWAEAIWQRPSIQAFAKHERAPMR